MAAQQKIQDDETRVGGHDVVPTVLGDQRRGFVQRHEPVLDGFTVLVRRDEMRLEPEVVHENGLPLKPVRLRTADTHFADRHRRRRDVVWNARFLPRFPDHRFSDGGACRNASADQIVEQARIDGLVGATSREPHRRRVAADQAVDVRSVGPDPKEARGGTFYQA
jgi:hypothetical protein